MWGGQTPHNLVILCLCYASQTSSEVPISSLNRDTARLGRGDRILLPSVIPAQVQGRHNTTRSTLTIGYPFRIQCHQTRRRITPGIPPSLAVAPVDRTQQGIWDWPVQSPRQPQVLILFQKLRRKQKKRAATDVRPSQQSPDPHMHTTPTILQLFIFFSLLLSLILILHMSLIFQM